MPCQPLEFLPGKEPGVILESDEDHLRGSDVTVRPDQIPAPVAQLVEHLTRHSGGPGSNPGVFRYYFSHPVTHVFYVYVSECPLNLLSFIARNGSNV